MKWPYVFLEVSLFYHKWIFKYIDTFPLPCSSLPLSPRKQLIYLSEPSMFRTATQGTLLGDLVLVVSTAFARSSSRLHFCILLKVRLLKAMVFPVVVYGCESWTIKKAERQIIEGFWTVMLKKILESLLDCKEIQPVHPKGNSSWIFIGRIDAEAETPILWPPDAKNWLIWKDADAGKDWRQEEKRATEDKMVGWHHRFNGNEFE